MIKNNRLFALILRSMIVSCGVLGIIFLMLTIKTVGILKYYSVTVTLFATLYYAYLLLKTGVDYKYSGRHGLTMLDIWPRGYIISGVFSSAALNLIMDKSLSPLNIVAETTGAGGLFTFGKALIAVVFPVLVLLDWAMFSKKYKFKNRNAFRWLLYPLSFFCVHIVRYSILSGKHAVYYFLDIQAMTVKSVIVNIGILMLLFLFINLIFVLLDTALGEPVVLFSWSQDESNSLQIESDVKSA